MYQILLEGEKIGHTALEQAEPSMGVVSGKILFNNISSPYSFFREYCFNHSIKINTNEQDYQFLDTQVIPQLQVFRSDGIEIKGVAGNAINGMAGEGFMITVLGVPYPFFQEEFPHHISSNS